MSGDGVDGGLAGLRRRQPALFAAGQIAIVVIIVAAVVFADPIPALISMIPLPDPPDLPDVPGWMKRVKNGVIIALLLLSVIGGVLESQRKRGDASRAGDAPDT